MLQDQKVALVREESWALLDRMDLKAEMANRVYGERREKLVKVASKADLVLQVSKALVDLMVSLARLEGKVLMDLKVPQVLTENEDNREELVN